MTELICIVCPRGCHLRVVEDHGYSVSGHGCSRGETYGKNELSNPVRIVTSTVRINGARIRRCPVKTNGALPKNLVMDAVKLLDSVHLYSPIRRGQAIIEDVCGTGISFIAVRDL
ncbi:DUF1667 domain-containing protein [Breznakiella homolactica]|uniref:DUF1667 domain-containing protein n=1 Tax=Breznakiella homolactica TaxID=2798577 RepID=A0A7T8B8C0_9SPIR|nr:DUF1667 domain-containing protein [Breznakiella homolactica]QQO08419.1 DUF1667 domain-containing protein [Breznakiella homolactica]